MKEIWNIIPPHVPATSLTFVDYIYPLYNHPLMGECSVIEGYASNNFSAFGEDAEGQLYSWAHQW